MAKENLRFTSGKRKAIKDINRRVRLSSPNRLVSISSERMMDDEMIDD
jgi:hypothetical protein